MHTSFSLPSFAKVNLYLRVLGKRDDGYHELCTVFQTVSLHDTLAFEESDELELTCDDERVPTDESNLIMRAARALQEMTGRPVTGKVHLTKRIPSPGGLGGGSSNAFAAIVGLGRLCGLGPVSAPEMRGLAAELGADVPFFLYGGTAVGTGRGDHILPRSEDVKAENILIVTPDAHVSTAEAFAALNARTLTSGEQKHNLTVCRNEAESLDLRHSVLINDFERSVFAAHPEIGEAKEALLELGAVNALLSGSGASVFGIFDKEETRQTAMKALDIRSTWRTFAVAAISRAEYRDAFRR